MTVAVSCLIHEPDIGQGKTRHTDRVIEASSRGKMTVDASAVASLLRGAVLGRFAAKTAAASALPEV